MRRGLFGSEAQVKLPCLAMQRMNQQHPHADDFR